MVALKFMRSHEQFMCELRSRSCLAIQKDHVVGIIKHYGGGDTGNLEVLECTAKLSWLVFLSVDSKSYVMLMLIPMPYYYNMSVTYLHAYYLDCSFHSLPLAPSHPHPHYFPFLLYFFPYFSPYIIQEEAAFRLDAISKGFQAYPYCLVMEAGDDTLKRIIGDQHIAGSGQYSF